VRRQLREGEESGDSMKSLRWDGATLRKARNATLIDCLYSCVTDMCRFGCNISIVVVIIIIIIIVVIIISFL